MLTKVRQWFPIAVSAVVMTSCSGFLEVDSPNEITDDKFWNEKSDVDNMVMGCYDGLHSEPVIRRMMVWGEFRSDNVSTGLNIDKDPSLENIFKENLNASNAYTSWVSFYNVINSCNLVLLKAPKVAKKDLSYTESELRATEAEMSAIRDLCYFYLIRTFRDVPYSTQAFVSDDQLMALPATKFNVVLDSLISDLEHVKGSAVKRYPVTKKNYQTGRITLNAIHSMLCEMYLWKQDYQNCIKYADLVIDAKKKENEELQNSASGTNKKDNLNGFPLVVNSVMDNYYGNAYRQVFGVGNSQESIFELTFGKGDDNMLQNGAENALYGNAVSSVGYAAPSTFVSDDVRSKQFRLFKNKYDARGYQSIDLSSSRPGIAKYIFNDITINATGSDLEASYSGLYPENKCKGNWIIYRLSDIMLMKAEALTQLMKDGSDADALAYNESKLKEAFALVNAVNKRSVCQTTLKDTLVANDYKTKSTMNELVYQERQREFLFEGKRWFDLVRRSRRDGNTEFLSTQVLQKYTDNISVIQSKLSKMDAIYWPYNIEDIKVGNLHQNPAFGSGENGNYEKTNK